MVTNGRQTRRNRAGMTLIELTAAIPLIALVGIVAVMLLLNGQRVLRKVEGHTSRAREARYAVAALANAIRDAHARDILAWNDTLLELNTTVGVGFLCGQSSPSTIALLPSTGTGPTRSTWIDRPEEGDIVGLAEYKGAGMATHGTQAAIAYVTNSDTACSNSTTGVHHVGPRTQLELSTPLAGRAVAGSPVRISRKARVSLYKAGDGKWYVGMRYHRASGWETIQPVAGPFVSASERGMRIEVISRSGNVLAARAAADTSVMLSSSAPALINLVIRAAADWSNTDGSRDADSVLTSIALRNR